MPDGENPVPDQEPTADEEMEAPAPPSPAPHQHWLVRTARTLKLEGAETLTLPAETDIAAAWAAVCAASGLTEAQLAEALAARLRLPLADLAAGTVEAALLVPEALTARFGVRALADDGRTLLVATADPMDAEAEQSLAFACHRRIRFAVAPPSALAARAEAPRVADDAEAELEQLLADIPSATTDSVRVEEEQAAKELQVDGITSEPIIKLANLIVREAVRQSASDIHLEPEGTRGLIRFRVDGVLRPFMHVPLLALHRVISRFKIIGRMDIADRLRPQDGSVKVRVDGRPVELRLSTVPTQDAEKAVIRIAGAVSDQTLDQLGIPAPELARLRQLLGRRDGIIIVTGPTGSGKTTTLYGALSELNTGATNIMTVEDPIERELPGVTQIQLQPKRNVTFASALRAILRQDPDVILIGEIRDLETAEIALRAAMTGHLVLTTLHTTSAVGVVDRLRDMGVERAALASTLRGVVAQRLARHVCEACAGAGCADCGDSGHRGRIPLLEVLTVGPAFAEMVGRGALAHELQTAAVADGMRPIRDVAAEQVLHGRTTMDEIVRVLGEEPDAPRALAPGRGGGADFELIEEVATGDVATAAALVPAAANGTGASATQPAAKQGRARGDVLRAFLQGLDRCVAEGQREDELLYFACEQLAAAYEAPLVWTALLDDGALSVRARAGVSAPYLRDVVRDWTGLESDDGAVATALRTGTPQGRHLDEEHAGFDAWRENARAHGLPIFVAVPLMGAAGAIGVVGIHARSMAGFDRSAGGELVNLIQRLTGVLERLRQLKATGLHLSALELAADSVFTTDTDGVILWVNRSFCRLSGYEREEVVGQTPRLLRSDRQDPAFFQAMWHKISAGTAWRGELFNRRRDGSEYAVEQTITPIVDERGRVTHYLAVQRDITDRRQRERDATRLITHDVETGLPNGRALEHELTRAITAAAAGREEAALMLLNIDGAAAIRDGLGPAVADRVAAEVASVLTATLRPGDYLARLGDVEFAALLPATPADGALICADRLRAAVAGHDYGALGLAGPPSLDVGIAVIDGTQAARAVIALADASLYGAAADAAPQARAEGDGESLREEWGRRLRDALRDDLFFLHFQPVMRLDTRSVSHFDVLLRLQDSSGAVIPARAFIPHAEALGLMPQLDRWVVDNVLRMLMSSPELSVSLNLSPSTVLYAGFRQFLKRQSRRMSAASGRIIFEVPEAASTAQLPLMVEHMNRLRDLGCRFALDNFGIGPASLASIGALPVDYVKLDGSLVRGVDLDPARHELVRGLTTIAQALGKEVIAGWAERESIVETLKLLGINLAQGHYLGSPGAEPGREAAVPPPTRLEAADHEPAEPALPAR